MDYMVLSTLQACTLMMLMLSYDINCQYHKNFQQRQQGYSPELRLNHSEIDVQYVIPKFHLPAHGPDCQTKFSLNYLEGVGRTCAEGIEQTWSGLNAVSTSAREMSPGSRQDNLDGQLNSWNFRKIIRMG